MVEKLWSLLVVGNATEAQRLKGFLTSVGYSYFQDQPILIERPLKVNVDRGVWSFTAADGDMFNLKAEYVVDGRDHVSADGVTIVAPTYLFGASDGTVYVFKEAATVPELTVTDERAFYARLKGVSVCEA